MRFPGKATVPSDMSLDLHFGCRFSPGMRRLSICTLQDRHQQRWENSFDLQEDGQTPSVVDTFPNCNWTLQEVVQKCHSLPFSASSVWAARGLSKLLAANGDMSSNNRQPVKLLETNRSASWWSINLVPVYIMKSWRFSGVISEAAMVCMIWFSEDFRIGKPKFAARLCCTLTQTHHYQAVISIWMEFTDLNGNSWSPASAREVLAPIQQPIVNDLNAIERQTKPIQAAALEFFQSSVNFNVFNALISNLYHERTSLRPRLRPTEKRDRNGLCLAGLRSPWTLTSGQSAATHEDSTSRGFLCFLIKFWTFSLHSTPKTCPHQYSKLEWQHHPAHLFPDQMRDEHVCHTWFSRSAAPWLGPQADAGTGRPVQWQNGRLAVQVCESLVRTWIPKCWGFEGEIPTQRNCVTSLYNLLVSRRCSI